MLVDSHQYQLLLGCGHSSLPLKYLGLPLGAKFKDLSVWNLILERMERRLASWKRMYLSKGGKVTLIKSSLSSLPTYFLSLLPLPGKVAKRMKKLHRDFLWNEIGGESKIHLVNWAKFCKPLQVGGLGIRRLGSFNFVLLGKWMWRYGMETDVLWRRVIEAKYGNIWGSWYMKKRYIRSGWLNFSKLLVYDVDDGTRVKFWKHVWCGDCTLQEAFPKLYCLSRSKDSSVVEVMGWFDRRVHWNVQFRHPPQDWEEEAFDRFMGLVYSSKVRGFGPDKVCWKPARNRGFEVRGYYSSFYPTNPISFPWRMIWHSKIKFHFFIPLCSPKSILLFPVIP
ncbi:hypothetical protein ACB092_08G010100 [Castanea dentata]